MLRPRLRTPLRPRLTAVPAQSTLLPLACRGTRSIHSILPLSYDTNKEAQNNGIPKFLSKDAFNIAWTQYQSHCLEELNRLIGGMYLGARP
jgi:Fe-Mn family superoxide dismutase